MFRALRALFSHGNVRELEYGHYGTMSAREQRR